MKITQPWLSIYTTERAHAVLNNMLPIEDQTLR